jgi:hypothetical protein
MKYCQPLEELEIVPNLIERNGGHYRHPHAGGGPSAAIING